ncbi:N-acyl homoserine lactonase family protein [bacterium]
MNIQLYFFSCGTLKSKKHFFTMNKGINEPFEVPVPFFLIKHPKGNVLFDTGNALEVAKDSQKHWGAAVEAYLPVMREDEYVVNQLKTIGINPEDIRYVVLSHLHLDHAGGVGAFPNATYIVQRKELEWAYVPDFYQKLAYIKADFDKDVKWLLLEGEKDDNYDIFGDGKLKIWFTPGHSPGHQALLISLENSGDYLLADDSCYTEEILNEDILPGLMWSPTETIRSINRMRYARDVKDVKIITGHDSIAWDTYKKAPEYYD